MRQLIMPLFALLLVAACCPYIAAESPDVLPPGNVAVGGIVAASWLGPLQGTFGLTPANLGVQCNVGILPGVDAGLMLSALSGVAGEVRYQVLREPLLVCAGLGASHSWRWNVDPFSDNAGHTWQVDGLHPTVTVGTRNVYGGVRVSVLRVEENPMSSPVSITYPVMPELLVGVTTGDRFQVSTTGFVALLAGGGSLSVGGGLGLSLRYTFGTRRQRDTEF